MMDIWTEENLTPAARAIVHTASALFYEHGITAVGVDRIAEESGVTKRTLYNRFESKEKLVCIYLQRRHALWWQAWNEEIARAEAPRALCVFDSYLSGAESHHRGCAFLNASAELPDHHPAMEIIANHKKQVRNHIAYLLQEDRKIAGQAEKSESQIQALAEHIFLLLEGAVVHLRFPDGYRHFEEAHSIAAELIAQA